jgi:oligosaccharide repeat unit polymerase
VVVSNLYFIYNGINESRYAPDYLLRTNIETLFNKASFYYFIGFVSILGGYKLIPAQKFRGMTFYSETKFNTIVTKCLIVLFIIAGIINLLGNINTVDGGDFFKYMSNMGDIDRTQNLGLGYLLYPMAVYLLIYLYFKQGKTIDVFFLAVVIIGFIMKLSTGRIASAFFYVISILVLIYYNQKTNLQTKFTNKSYYATFFVIILLGFFFFFFRRVGNLIYQQGGISSEIVEGLNDNASYLLIGSGNIPNTPLFMKIIDSWEIDHGFLYGESFITWLYNGVPSRIKPLDYQPSVMIKQLWYPGPGGNLPPTSVGEMYMNFGFWGPVAGLFFVGLLFKLIKNYVVKSGKYWVYVIYASIFLPFTLIYPKGEFDNINMKNLITYLIPYILVIILSFFFQKNNNVKA